MPILDRPSSFETDGRTVRPRSKIPLPLLLATTGLAVLLCGCWWQRLLAFKNQLANFDRYVKVEETNGLILTFVKPVVQADDLRQLTQLEPSDKSVQEGHEVWQWIFEKQAHGTNADQGRFDFTFKTIFTNQKFSQFTIPEPFLVVVPKSLVLGGLRSVGRAEIDYQHRVAKVRWQEGEKDIRPLTEAEITRLLGPASLVRQSGTTTSWIYTYVLKTSLEPSSKRKTAQATFIFDTATHRLRQIEARFASLRFDYSFH